MRYTPFLDSRDIKIKVPEDIPEDATKVFDHLIHVIDSCLSEIDARINWGSYEGRKRRPCPEQPLLLAGMPIGMYHCPVCGMMIVAGLPHSSPSALPDEVLPGDSDYEVEYGQPWPAGYEESEEADVSS